MRLDEAPRGKQSGSPTVSTLAPSSLMLLHFSKAAISDLKSSSMEETLVENQSTAQIRTYTHRHTDGETQHTCTHNT
jgi:hypothetical protein